MITTTKGFTLIEVLVAVFIIAVSLIGLVIGFSNGFAWMEEMEETSVANHIAQEKMEELRGGIISIPATSWTTSENIQGCSYGITFTPTSLEPALTQVTVTVSWNSHSGKALSRSLVTYFTENGITKK